MREKRLTGAMAFVVSSILVLGPLPAAADDCPPDMVAVDDFCIDRYEAPNVGTGFPLVMFSFVEAEAWCEARGRRLCFDDEWTRACEGAAALSYPYGNTHVPGWCNDEETFIPYNQALLDQWPIEVNRPEIDSLAQLLTAARSVSSAAASSADHVEAIYQGEAAGANLECESDDGVVDMCGNAEEWTRRRDGGIPDFHGNLKGGYWAQSRTCRNDVTSRIDYFHFYETGFRCCRDQDVIFADGFELGHPWRWSHVQGSTEWRPYITNPTLGSPVTSGSITVDGSNTGEWEDNALIAIDMAGDDPRNLGPHWSMHEAAFDLTHLWARWDDTTLYLAWQYVDVTDVVDPANAGSSGANPVRDVNLFQWIAIDTIAGQGAALDMWGKNFGEPYWTGADLPDFQVYIPSNLLLPGYISPAVGGVFSLEPDDGYMSTVGAGLSTAVGGELALARLWGVMDVDDALAIPVASDDVVDFSMLGHDGGRGSFYEMSIPLSVLNITRTDLEADGIGVMLGQGEGSCVDTIPNDLATTDTVGVSPGNSPLEWADVDSLTTAFARIGHE